MNRRRVLVGSRCSPCLLVLAWPHFAAAQTAAADEPQFPIASRLGLTPPPGMTLSTSFQGFEDTANNIYIRLVAMPEAAYAEIEKSMTNQALKKQNITVEKREPFALPNAKGMLVVARQEAGNEKLRKWLLDRADWRADRAGVAGNPALRKATDLCRSGDPQIVRQRDDASDRPGGGTARAGAV